MNHSTRGAKVGLAHARFSYRPAADALIRGGALANATQGVPIRLAWLGAGPAKQMPPSPPADAAFLIGNNPSPNSYRRHP